MALMYRYVLFECRSIRLVEINQYDITMGNDVVTDAYCEMTMGSDVTMDIHCNVRMSNDVAMYTYQCNTMLFEPMLFDYGKKNKFMLD